MEVYDVLVYLERFGSSDRVPSVWCMRGPDAEKVLQNARKVAAEKNRGRTGTRLDVDRIGFSGEFDHLLPSGDCPF